MRGRRLRRYIKNLDEESRDLLRRSILAEAEKVPLSLSLSKEEMREEVKKTLSLKSLPLYKIKRELTSVKRELKEFLEVFPETKTIQPELYNKILILCGVIEELIS